METAVRNGIEGIVAECGGSLSCATCHVYLDEADADKVPPMSEMEDEMLYGTTEEREENSRLSCQLKLGADTELHVTTPETQV
jgi:2Fe-2S ferredoxin